MKVKNLTAILIVGIFVAIAVIGLTFFAMSASLPKMISLEDYKPKVVSQVFARDGQKVGEFAKEKRIVIPYSKIPKQVVQAFISAEDSKFFEHKGINFVAIIRAAIANLKAGHTVQGGSTITQQVAKSLMLSSVKTFTRKFKEAILSFRMEKHLKKEDILFLYLNQIFLGHHAYGIEAAAENYFRKHVEELTLAEAAILAGLPQAPSNYSPLKNPMKSKERQLYVLSRMAEEGYITKDEARKAGMEEIKIYYNVAFEDLAPFYIETIRQFLSQQLGEDAIWEEGVKIYTGMDLKKQIAAQESVSKNLRDLDKRQGYRGPKKNLTAAEDIAAFLTKSRDELVMKILPYRILYPDGKDPNKVPLDLTRKNRTSNLTTYLKLGQTADGVVTKVDSKLGLVTVRVAEAVGMIDIEDMKWARKPDVNKHWSEDLITDPAKALKQGDIIEVRVKSEKFVPTARLEKLVKPIMKKGVKVTKPEEMNFAEYLGLSLEQEPSVEAAVLSYDLDTQEIITMVGGSNFSRNEYNRAIQAARQTGSSFKPLVYAAALEKGYAANTIIQDAPIVYEEGEGQESKKWKPGNFENKFTGDILFRTALIKSLNIPTIKIEEKIGLDWIEKYARRLGIFSPLNKDFTLAIGSSSVTLFEMTRAYSTFARMGRRIHPILVKKVTDFNGEKVLAENILVERKFEKELNKLELEFHPELAGQLNASGTPTETTPMPTPTASATPKIGKDGKEEPNPFNFANPDQLISPQSAYLITHLMKGVVQEGTGARAKALGRPSAGKTGTTNGYYDAWYIGFTPQIMTGVWVGFDNEKPIGRLETGASAALPIWVDYMKEAVEGAPSTDFAVPPGIVFANIDNETGKLASTKSKKAVREAFREGAEPSSSSETSPSEEKNFFKEDLSD